MTFHPPPGSHGRRSWSGASLGGCSTIAKLNPFDKHGQQGRRHPGRSASRWSPSTRRSRSAEALKGQPTSSCPRPQLVDAWPQPGGPAQGWVDNVAAGPDFQVAWRTRHRPGHQRRATTSPPRRWWPTARSSPWTARPRCSALDADTGADVWRTDVGGRRPGRDKEAFGGGVAYANGKLYVSSGYRFVAALDAASGRVLWRTAHRRADPRRARPSAAAGCSPSTSTTRWSAFDADDRRAGLDLPGAGRAGAADRASSPAVSGDTVIGAFASGELVALRTVQRQPAVDRDPVAHQPHQRAVGDPRHRRPAGDLPGRRLRRQPLGRVRRHRPAHRPAASGTSPITTITTPWPAGDVVYVVAKAGEVIAASRASGQVYWIRDLNAGITKRKKRSLFSARCWPPTA